MYNSDLVRKLCGDILNAKDPGRVQDLISLLRAVIKEAFRRPQAMAISSSRLRA